MASLSRSLHAWPPNPALISLHILARCVALFTNAIGIGLCFGSGVRNDYVSVYVAGSFMSTSMLVEPIFIIWNARQLRRNNIRKSTRSHDGVSGYERLTSAYGDEQIQQPGGTKFLKFAALVDFLAFLAYTVVYSYSISDATQWHYRGPSDTVLMAYASASILVCVVLHAVLAFTQCLQISFAYTRELKDLRCPHCNHRMGSPRPLNTSDSRTLAAQGPLQQNEHESTQGLLNQDLVDTDPDAVPVNAMAIGQVTGTCQITPRTSESTAHRADSPATVIEGSSAQEHDRLIEKSK